MLKLTVYNTIFKTVGVFSECQGGLNQRGEYLNRFLLSLREGRPSNMDSPALTCPATENVPKAWKGLFCKASFLEVKGQE